MKSEKNECSWNVSCFLLFLLALILLASCGSSREHILIGNVLTREQQALLTPQAVLDTLIKGNQEFIDDNLTIRNNTARVRAASVGQFPMAVILSCLDSRVPVEDIFHRGIGDLFVARVAGNVVDNDILGSLEYACKVSGSKLIVVLGHEYCGAITSAINNVKIGHITSILDKIQPAVEKTKMNFTGEATTSNARFVHEVCEENVHVGIKKIRESEILRNMEENGEIMIIGGVYEMNTGKVTFF